MIEKLLQRKHNGFDKLIHRANAGTLSSSWGLFFLKYFILYFNYRNIKVINLQKPLNRNSCCFPTDILDFSDMACLEEVHLKAIEVNF